MRAVIQRVSQASVTIKNAMHARIGQGMLVLLGIEESDNAEDVSYLASKICQMRIFGDDTGKLNLSLSESDGELLIVSQFTLFASTRKGHRPSFIKAARPETAIPLYERFLAECSALTGKDCQSGVFGADMKVSLTNDGPVTILLDSKNKE